MKNLLINKVHLFFLLFVFFGFMGCNETEPEETDTRDKASILARAPNVIAIDNAYVKIEDTAESFRFHIKKKVSKPTLILKNGDIKEYAKVDDIKHADFQEVRYVLLPTTHPLVENPFKRESSLFIVRPSIWKSELVNLRNVNESSLFALGNTLSAPVPPRLARSQFKNLFENDFESRPIGEGGIGKVYEASYKGKQYIIKENAFELGSMEALQFTDAVAKIYAGATANNRYGEEVVYMVMEKGEGSLKSFTDMGQKLEDSVTLDAIAQFKKLVTAQKILNIRNRDVKGDNILSVTSGTTRRLFVIDIFADGRTPGYLGTEGQLLSRALLENQIGKALTGGDFQIKFRDYYNAFDAHGRDLKRFVASPAIIESWLQAQCRRSLPGDPSCDAVKEFGQLYKALPLARRAEIGQSINQDFRDQGGFGDQRGTHDDILWGLYRTGLPLPQVKVLDDLEWQQYYHQRKEIGRKFCKNIVTLPAEPRQQSAFFVSLAPIYAGDCQWATNNFLRHFTGADDADFRTWITDALSPLAQFEAFRYLAKSFQLEEEIRKIIEHRIGKNTPIGKGLLELHAL